MFQLHHNASCGASWLSKGFNGPVNLLGISLFSPLSVHCVKAYIFAKDVAKEGRYNVRKYLIDITLT